MTDVAALDKHACPACGAMANWNAAQQALVCPYCGTVSPVELAADGSVIKEHDLVAALRAVPDDKKGWEADRVSVQCQSCKAISLFEPGRVAQNCEFCGSPQIIPQSAVRAPIVPESVLPFVVAETQVREDLRRWYGSRWFAPNRLKGAALTDKVHGLYIPYWTFDAQVAARWTAEAGHYYYVTERRGNKTEQVRKVRWEPAAGALDHFFDDELVPATQGVPADLLRKVEPFPTQSLVPVRRRLRVRLGGRAVPDRPRRRRPERPHAHGRDRPRSCARRRCRATRSATCRSTPTTRSRPSSTSSCRSGSSPTTTARARSRCWSTARPAASPASIPTAG